MVKKNLKIKILGIQIVAIKVWFRAAIYILSKIWINPIKNRRLLSAVSDGVVGRTRFQVGVQVENSKVKKLAIFCPNNLNQQREKRCLIGI